jgi:hypothetical protein
MVNLRLVDVKVVAVLYFSNNDIMQVLYKFAYTPFGVYAVLSFVVTLAVLEINDDKTKRTF